MIERGQGYEVDCFSVQDNAIQINETEVYVAFMDRFYNVAETAIMALAVGRSGHGPFSILGFVNGAVLELNGADPHLRATADSACIRNPPYLPAFVIEQEVTIPEGYADLGDRQLNEILSNTRYHSRRRHAHDDLQNQYRAARAFQSGSDVRDAPGGSRGRSVPAQPLELPIPSRPEARPRTESPSGPNVRQRTEPSAAKAPPPRGNRPAQVFDNLGYVINLDEPRQAHFTRLDLKAAKDPRLPRGMESQAIPKFEDLKRLRDPRLRALRVLPGRLGRV